MAQPIPRTSLLIPFAIFLLSRDRTVRFALAAAALVFILWAFGPQQLRFLTPAIGFAGNRMGQVK